MTDMIMQTDGTRASDLESHIQSRVHTELQRLHAKTDESLKELEERISTAATDNPDGMKAPGAADEAFRFEDSKTKDLSRAKVQKEIDSLKEKLGKRQLRDDVVNDKGVEKAKTELVSCLRVNDRRPLDCWQEVESFKVEVGRLEGQFLGRALQ